MHKSIEITDPQGSFFCGIMSIMNAQNIIHLDNLNIPELDLYVGNKEVHLLRYFEPEPGIFIAETRNVIDIALRQGFEPISLVCTENMLRDELISRVGDIPIYVVDPDAAQKHFGYVLTGGITAAFRRKRMNDHEAVLADAHRVVVLDNVENPTNVGAIFRTAAALGIDGVLLTRSCADPLYRRAMRVSVGNTLLVPWAWIDGIETVKDDDFALVAMALGEDNVTIDEPELKSLDRLAIVMGNEGDGLPEETVELCDYVAKIPMMNGVDSLNVAVAAGLAMWELGRR